MSWSFEEHWTDGCSRDLEDEATGKPHDDIGDAEESLGWNEKVSQLPLGRNTDEGDATALEAFGKGFRRSGHDAERDEDRGSEDSEDIGHCTGPVRPLRLTKRERATVRGLARRAKTMREVVHA